jgi:hypothetical protein
VHNLYRGKYNFQKKQSTVNNQPMGENSSNLVTLTLTFIALPVAALRTAP